MGIQLPAYGDNTQPTPHLSQLASEGVVFETAHVTSASCAPSRASMHSGLYPIQNGVWGFVGADGYKYRPGLTTFVELLHNSGYTTGLTYKTGVNDPVTYPGASPADWLPSFVQAWDFVDDWLKKVDPFTNKPVNTTNNPELRCEHIWRARLFEYFLNHTVVPGTPFYFLGQVFDTHFAGWLGSWPDSSSAVTSSGEKGACNAYIEGSLVEPAAVDSTNFQGLGPYTLSTANAQKLAGYYAAVQRVDHYVGRMLELLKDSGHEQNTLTIFSSDHGISHTCMGKQTAYEGGLRVPLIIRWPGRVAAAGARINALVSTVDFAPTILEAAGIAPPSYYPGHSVVPVLEGTATPTRRYLFSAFTSHTTWLGQYWPTRSARDARFKIIHNIMVEGEAEAYSTPCEGWCNNHNAVWGIKCAWTTGACSGCSQCASSAPMSFNQGYEGSMCPMGSNPYLNRDTHPRQVFELYDLIADRHETTSLIGNPEHATTEARLKAALDHWRRTVLDDPFLDAGFRRRFHTQELATLDWFKAKVASERSNPTGLWWKVNRSEYSPVWDDAQYSTQDPLIAAPAPQRKSSSSELHSTSLAGLMAIIGAAVIGVAVFRRRAQRRPAPGLVDSYVRLG